MSPYIMSEENTLIYIAELYICSLRNLCPQSRNFSHFGDMKKGTNKTKFQNYSLTQITTHPQTQKKVTFKIHFGHMKVFYWPLGMFCIFSQ